METAPLSLVAVSILLGVAGQGLASLTRVPAIVFLLLLGIGAGPYGLHLVEPAGLGGGLTTLTSAFIAIILFEGSLSLSPTILRQAIRPVRRLITWGAAGTLIGAAVASRFLVDLPWPLAFLFASLVVVTGPTVIAPILRRVRLTPRLHAVLKSESILIDPVGVFVAVVLLQYVAALPGQETGWRATLLGFATRVASGVLIGGAAGGAAALLSRLRLLHRRGNDHLVSLGALGLALCVFALAERCQSDSGVLAVVVAGLILAAVPLPFRHELEKFKEQLSTLGVSILFILLAANLDLSLLRHAGWREVALVAGLMLVVRPASVFLSTLGTSLSYRERAYLALIAPRGILAAAMAGYFAAHLRQHGLAGASRIEMLVFLTIGATVCIQGSWAAPLSRLLGVRAQRPAGVLLVGVNEWSMLLARELRSWKCPVLLVDNNPLKCDVAREEGVAVCQGDATDEEFYQHIDFSTFGVLLAMTPNDAVNTLACEAARSWLGRKGVLQVISKPADGTCRATVRMAGRRAMPALRPHREVVELLRAGRLLLTTHSGDRPIPISDGLTTDQGPLLPLLVLEAGRPRIAAEGDCCPTGGMVLGLVPAGPRRGEEQAGCPDPTPQLLIA